jgi:GNAT superfamily N-acetyltransferase
MAYIAESLESAAEQALHEAAGGELSRALGLARVPVAEGVALCASALPASAVVANRVIGLGLERPITPAAVAEAVAVYREADVARFFLHVHPDAATPGLPAILADAGLEPARGWQKFSRDLGGDLPSVDTPFTLRDIDDTHAAAFAEIVCAAFELGEVAVPWLACLPTAPGWRAVMAFDGDTPVGAGALFVQGEAAWTDFGATAPAHRGRGVQRAHLAHRVHLAKAQGCRRLYTCTGEAVPGDPQHSYANILRCGFEEDYVRANWAPPKPG